jgi:hypothetical protein
MHMLIAHQARCFATLARFENLQYLDASHNAIRAGGRHFGALSTLRHLRSLALNETPVDPSELSPVIFSARYGCGLHFVACGTVFEEEGPVLWFAQWNSV